MIHGNPQHCQTPDKICQIFPNYVDVIQEDYVFCLSSDGLIMLAQENSPCFVLLIKGRVAISHVGNTMSIIICAAIYKSGEWQAKVKIIFFKN